MKFKLKTRNTGTVVKQLLERRSVGLIICRSMGLPKEHIRGILRIREVILLISTILKENSVHTVNLQINILGGYTFHHVHIVL